MRSQYSVCICIVTIFILSLPIKIECCSLNTYDIIVLMAENPNYENDPCYIQWQAVENAKLTDLWAKRKKFEESMRESNRKQRQREAQAREDRNRANQQRMNETSTYSSKTTETKTGHGSTIAYVTIIGIIVGMICFGACVSAVRRDNQIGTMRNTLRTNLHQNENRTTQRTLIVTRTVLLNPTVSTSNENQSREECDTHIPLNVPKRKDSLPSYDDALKMASAP